MSVPCQLIGDLLPLYYDQVCSDDSRVLVEEHLKTCPACRQALADLREQMEHPQEDMEGMREAKNAWTKEKRKAFGKGVLCVLLAVVIVLTFVRLFVIKDQPVAAEDILISQVCQMKDGSLLFHWYVDDGKKLGKVDCSFETNEDGTSSMYFTPMHALIELNRTDEAGLFNAYVSLYIQSDVNDMCSRGSGYYLNPSVTKLYMGTPEDCILVWERGQELPAASPAMEEMAETYSYPFASDINWDYFYARVQEILGDEMFQKEDVQ